MNRKLERSGLRIKAQCGFTLIEVLVALLVLAIGLVGIASLNINGLRNAHSSYYTTIASSVALDFEERLWIAMTDVPEGCLDEVDDVLPIIADLQAAWGVGGAGTITIPGLEVGLEEFGLASLNGGDDVWAEAQIRLTWEDSRFGGEETFPYTARVLCAPEGDE